MHRTHIKINHHLVVETIHLKRLRAQQEQTAPCSGIFRWAGGACGVDDGWRTRVDSTETGCLRARFLSNTETLKWRKVYVPIPIIRNNRMVKGLSIPIVRNNRGVKGLSMPIVRNMRFRLAVPIVYRPKRHALEIPIDSYLFQR